MIDGYNLNNEKSAAEFFMAWCNRPDFESYRNEKRNKMMFQVLTKIKNGEYDIQEFIDGMIETRRFDIEYEEFKNRVDGKRDLAKLKIDDLMLHDYDRLKKEVGEDERND